MTLARRLDAISDLITGIQDDHYPTALDVVQALRMAAETAESTLPLAVDAARRGGHTWDQIGTMLGTSRQAAQQRYGSVGEQVP
jgi:hypothetical protein